MEIALNRFEARYDHTNLLRKQWNLSKGSHTKDHKALISYLAVIRKEFNDVVTLGTAQGE